jgi:hypothetical protein
VVEFQNPMNTDRVNWVMRILFGLYIIQLIIGVVPGLRAHCTATQVWPLCMFYMLFLHILLYATAFYLWKNEYLIEEDKIMAEARRLSQTEKPDEIDNEKKEELNKSEKLLDKVAAQSSFMKIYTQ